MESSTRLKSDPLPSARFDPHGASPTELRRYGSGEPAPDGGETRICLLLTADGCSVAVG